MPKCQECGFNAATMQGLGTHWRWHQRQRAKELNNVSAELRAFHRWLGHEENEIAPVVKQYMAGYPHRLTDRKQT